MRPLECGATNKNDGDLHGGLYSVGHDSSSNGDKLNSPAMVMTIESEYQLLTMRLSRSEFTAKLCPSSSISTADKKREKRNSLITSPKTQQQLTMQKKAVVSTKKEDLASYSPA